MIIVPDDGTEPREYALPRGVHVNVHEGERVRAGEQLMDGPSNPHDILRVLGEKELQKYLVNEIQEVYRLQGVNINDKHIEVIARQMMRWVKIEDVGDTEFLIDEQVDKFRFLEENERVIGDGGRPATAQPLLLGITKASLSTDSFISAASFQETTRVLTEASISGKIDHLRGLKENVTMGRLIPAGTGFEWLPARADPGGRAAAAAGAAAADRGRSRFGSRDRVRVRGRGADGVRPPPATSSRRPVPLRFKNSHERHKGISILLCLSCVRSRRRSWVDCWANAPPGDQAYPVLPTPQAPIRGSKMPRICLRILLASVMLVLSAPTYASTFTCSSGDVACLIAAINTANTNGEPENTIRLSPGTYTLTAVDNDTQGPNGLPSVTSTLTIRADVDGSEVMVVRAATAPGFRFLHAGSGAVLTVHGITLSGGDLTAVSLPAGSRDGAGDLYGRGSGDTHARGADW